MWNPQQYDRFQAARRRPGLDLIAALPTGFMPRRIVDLGCGTGTLTRLLAERWPDADIIGVDGSAAMLEKAAATPSRVRWVQGDIARWQHTQPPDLIFSNAALHWLDDHAVLFPKLITGLAAGGVLAVQMPRNFTAPSHRLLYQTADDPRWSGALQAVLRTAPVHEPAEYYRWLAPHAVSVDIWETEYHHVLDGADPVFEWARGTALLPVQERLPPALFDAFVADYRDRLRAAYPAEADGTTLLPFRRLFVTACKT